MQICMRGVNAFLPRAGREVSGTIKRVRCVIYVMLQGAGDKEKEATDQETMADVHVLALRSKCD